MLRKRKETNSTVKGFPPSRVLHKVIPKSWRQHDSISQQQAAEWFCTTGEERTHVTARSHPKKMANDGIVKCSSMCIALKSLNKQISRFAGLLVFLWAQPLLLESTCDADLASHAYHPVSLLNAGLFPGGWMFSRWWLAVECLNMCLIDF